MTIFNKMVNNPRIRCNFFPERIINCVR